MRSLLHVAVQRGDALAVALLRHQRRLVTLLGGAFLKRPFHIDAFKGAVKAVQLAIDKLPAARLFTADAQLIGGDQEVNNRFNSLGFIIGKKEQAGLVEGFGGIIGEGRPAR